MDFNKRMQKVNPYSIFDMTSHKCFTWCGTITKDDNNKYYLYFSFWEWKYGFDAWVSHSKIGYATSDSPLGPFVKRNEPIFTNPNNAWSVEDPFMWYEKGKFYAIAKDFQGYFTKGEKGSIALFESANGFDWDIADNPLAFNKELKMINGKTKKLARMERPQMYIDENGVPKVLCCACSKKYDKKNKHSFNVQIGICEE